MSEINTKIPPAGVIEDLLKGHMEAPDRFRFWLLLHTHIQGHLVVRKMVLDSCLPNPDELTFVAITKGF